MSGPGPVGAALNPLVVRHMADEPVIDAPVVVLAVARSFSSVIGTVVGRHPQLYGLPELHLWGTATVADWSATIGQSPLGHGLQRAVAELCFGEQTAASIAAARHWLRRRLAWNTCALMDELADLAHPRVLVEKSPSTVTNLSPMLRIERAFPGAHYVHLVRHPVGQGESILKLISEVQRFGLVRPWMFRLAGMGDEGDRSTADPTAAWYEQNSTILEFLGRVPAERQLTLRGEAVLTEPQTWCRRIIDWLGARQNRAAVQRDDASGALAVRLRRAAGCTVRQRHQLPPRPDVATERRSAGALPRRARAVGPERQGHPSCS